MIPWIKIALVPADIVSKVSENDLIKIIGDDQKNEDLPSDKAAASNDGRAQPVPSSKTAGTNRMTGYCIVQLLPHNTILACL